MSTAVATEKRGFQEAPAKDLPRLICTGYVTGVSKVAVSESSGRYIVAHINIEANSAGRGTKAFFCYRPEQLVNGFNPRLYENSVDDVTGEPLDEKLVKSLTFVYGKNIAMRDSISVIQGVCGSQEAADVLSDQLITDECESWDESAARVQEVLTRFFNTNVGPDGRPATIGYVLDQQQEKTGQVDEDGKPIYVKTANYNITKWFYPNERALKSWARSAEGSGGKTKITYDLW